MLRQLLFKMEKNITVFIFVNSPVTYTLTDSRSPKLVWTYKAWSRLWLRRVSGTEPKTLKKKVFAESGKAYIISPPSHEKQFDCSSHIKLKVDSYKIGWELTEKMQLAVLLLWHPCDLQTHKGHGRWYKQVELSKDYKHVKFERPHFPQYLENRQIKVFVETGNVLIICS